MKNNIYENLIIEDYANMQELLENFNSKVDEMLLEQGDIDYICIYAKSPLIQRVFKKLIHGRKVGLIDFANDFYDSDYRLAYCLSITNDGYLNIEKAYNEEGYPYHFEGIAFLYEEDVTQDLIDTILIDGRKTILFGFDELKDKKTKASVQTNISDSGLEENPSSEVDVKVIRKKGTDNIYGLKVSKKSKGISSYYTVYTTTPMSNSDMVDILEELGFKDE